MLLRSASLALAASLALGAPVASAATPAPAAAEHVNVTTPARPAASPTDSARYAQREQQDHKVANYQGGASVLIIGSSGAVIVVLLLLLILV